MSEPSKTFPLPSSESNEEASAAQSKPAHRRRPPARARQKAPPASADASASGFQFVTVQNPKIQKDKNFQSNVRRHVMVNYNRAKRGQVSSKAGPSQQRTPPSDGDASAVEKEDVEETDNKAIVKREPSLSPTSGQVGTGDFSREQSFYLHRCIGSALEPFRALPQITKTPFKVAIERIFLLTRIIFSTDTVDMNRMAFPYLHPLDFFSAIILAAKHADIVNGNVEDGSNSLALKTEIFHYVGRSNKISLGRMHLSYMHAVTRLLAYEVISRKEDHVKMHIRGLQKFVIQNGGLHNLFETALNYNICGAVFSAGIQGEFRPPQMFLDFVPFSAARPAQSASSDLGSRWSQLHNEDQNKPVFITYDALESDPRFKGIPMSDFNDANHYVPIQRSKRVSDAANNLIIAFQEVTNIFLGTDEKSSDPAFISAAIDSHLSRVEALPSTEDVPRGEPLWNDWSYEAMRLVCLVYFTALRYRIPFSAASEHLTMRRKDWCPKTSHAAFPEFSEREERRLPSTLFMNALFKTDMPNLWGPLAPVLLWTCLVMSAAARFHPGEFPRLDDSLANQWIGMTSMRCSLTVAFGPAGQFMGILRAILEIQSRLNETLHPPLAVWQS